MREILEIETVSPDDFIYLAHSARVARICAGAVEGTATSNSKLVRLAVATSRLHVRQPDSSAKARRDAISLVQHAMRDLAADSLKEMPDEDFLEEIGESSRTFAEGCLRISLQLNPAHLDPKSYLEALKKLLRDRQWNLWADASKLRSPSGNRWPDEVGLLPPIVQWSTVHGFKGLQEVAVGLAIKTDPKHKETSAVALWERGEMGESRRVLYVGASRAQRLLLLLVDKQDYGSIVNLLVASHVPHTCHPLPRK